jgi:predicted RNA-binding protein
MERELAKKMTYLFQIIFGKHPDEYPKEIQTLVKTQFQDLKPYFLKDDLETEVVEIESQKITDVTLESLEDSMKKIMRKNNEIQKQISEFIQKIEKLTSGSGKTINTTNVQGNSNTVIQGTNNSDINIGNRTINQHGEKSIYVEKNDGKIDIK